MCFNETTSWLTFLLGTGVNIWALTRGLGTRSSIGIAIVWQSVLLVQFVEAMIWRSIRLSNADEQARWSRVLMMLSFIQPLVFVLASAYTSKRYGLGMLLGFIYSVYALYCFSQSAVDRNSVIGPSKDCPNLEFKWWPQTPDRGATYIIVSALALLLLLRPMSVSLVMLVYLGLSFQLSSKLYPCASASIWCWLSAFAPLLTAFAT